jgi:hypothetical protein
VVFVFFKQFRSAILAYVMAMKFSRLATIFAFLGALIGYFACGLALRSGITVPQPIYWAFFLAIPVLSFFLRSNNEVHNIVLLLIVSTSVYSIYVLQNQTWYSASRDSQFELQITQLICENGRWTPGMGTSLASEMSVHPAMHFLLASTSLIGGIEPYQAIFLIPWLKGIGLTLFFYLFARHFLADKTAVFFASLALTGCFNLWLIPHRETFAIILFMAVLWLLVSRKNALGFKALVLLFMFSLAMAHHFTAYILLGIVIAFYAFSEQREGLIHPSYPIATVLSWIAFSSFAVALGYSMLFLNALRMVLTLSIPQTPNFAAASYFYAPSELAFMLAGPLVVGLFASMVFFPKIRTIRSSLLLILMAFLGILLFTSLALYPSGAFTNGTYRIWTFAYIPMVTLTGWFIWKGRLKNVYRTVISILLVVLLFVSMNLSTLYGIKKWYVPREYMESYMVSDSMVNTALWCREYALGTFFGDNLAHDTVGSWGRKDIDQYTFEMWYQTKDNAIIKRFTFLVFSPWDTTTYSDTFRKPTDPFSLLPSNLNIVYSSRDLTVYRWPFEGMSD